MKLTKDGADVCEVGYVTYGPVVTEKVAGELGRLGIEFRSEQTYYAECFKEVVFGAGRYRLVDPMGLDVAIDPIGERTEPVKDAKGNPIYRMQCYIYRSPEKAT